MTGQLTPTTPSHGEPELLAGIRDIRKPLQVVARDSDGLRGVLAGTSSGGTGYTVLGTLPPLYPEWLGDRGFGERHQARFPYVVGEMAHGIAGPHLVTAAARAGMVGVYGPAGLTLEQVDRELGELRTALSGRRNWGVNLIHAPRIRPTEDQIADLLLHHGVPCVSLSAFTDVTPAVARCVASGLREDRQGRVVRPTAVIAKVSRPDVAEKFMVPPSRELLRMLLDREQITAEEARLAQRVPVAEDITVEADSAGHTDRQPLVSALPAVLATRRMSGGTAAQVRVGVAGGLGEPAAIAAAFTMGADYVLTGSVNQMALEARMSDRAKAMLAEASTTDMTMCPSPIKFEDGVRIQVLRRGTLFAGRAARLHRIFQEHSSLEELPSAERDWLERDVLGMSLSETWSKVRAFWQVRERDADTLRRAESDPHLRLALTCRWYMRAATRWAIAGDPDRVSDYQLWCGPAAGAFNQWTAGSFLADPAERSVESIGLNLLEGAAVLARAQQVRGLGVPVPNEAFTHLPRRLLTRSQS